MISRAGTAVYEFGLHATDAGQAYYVASIVQVTPTLDTLSRGLTPGLLELRPWLVQVAADAPLPPPMPTPQPDPSPFVTATS